MTLVVLGWLGCTSPPPARPPVFVRTGVVGDDGERALADGRRFREGLPDDAPAVAECVTLGAVELGDLSSHVARGIAAPDTALAFSPDGSRLAVGTWLGDVLVLDGWTGAVRARRTLAESAVKRVAWSADGRELYAAEQSPDAYVRALDPDTLADRATFRMADDLQTSAPPGNDDLYGLYTLPGAYGLDVLGSGDLLVLGAHGWDGPDGRLNRSRVWRLKRQGDAFVVRSAWPAEGPADATLLAMTVGERVGVAVHRSAPGDAPDLPVGGVQILDADLRPVAAHVPDPLRPWFERPSVWDGVGMWGERVTLGLSDGRVWRPSGPARDLGTPVLAGDVPIAATIGHLVDAGDMVYTITSGTSIPWGAAAPDTRPPEPHPREDTVFALDPLDLRTVWAWRGEESLHGMAWSDPWLVVGVGPRGSDDRPDRHGVLVFDTRRPGTGAERLAASCPTGAPVFFRFAIAPDGRIAVATFPERVGESVRGSYAVRILL